MRPSNPRYIENLVRQVCQKKADLDEVWRKKHLTAGDLANTEVSIVKNSPDHPCLAYSHFDVPVKNLVGGMRNETLGKILSFGLGRGEICKRTFRKTPYSEISKLTEIDTMSGRNLMICLCRAVITAAVFDYLQVIKIAERDYISWKEAGRRYLED